MRNRFQYAVLLIFSGLLATAMVGCRNEPESASEEAERVAPISRIPLRITVLAPVGDSESLARQWLSNSEQPISIQSLSWDEFLGRSKAESDVVLYPALLLGELVEREWIVKLPSSIAENSVNEPSDEAGDATEPREASDLPPAWRAAAGYAGDDYAVPLSCSIPVVVGSDAFFESVSSASGPWDSVLEAIAQDDEPPQHTVETAELVADPYAVADRFLAVLFSITERNSRYGLLFDLKTMQPRLQEPNFQKTAEILRRLALQPGGLRAVLGSHDEAWRWAATHERPVVAIASSSALGPEAARIESGGLFEVEGYAFGNSGGGVLASLSADCRQTQQSVEFLRWLRSYETRNFLASNVAGIDSASYGGVESLAYRVRQSLREPSNSDQLPQEPRLPGAHQYRESLGLELIAFLQGEKTASDALRAASERWSAIAAKDPGKSIEQRQADYQRSLGLTQ